LGPWRFSLLNNILSEIPMELIPHDINSDFVGKRRFFLVFSAVLNVAAVVLMLTWGLNYGLDFTGGTLVEIRFQQPTTSGVIRNGVQGQGLEDLTIQDIGRDGRTFLLRFQQPEESVGETGQAVQTALASAFGESFELLRVESVGSRVSGGLRRKAFWAVAFATVLMGVYIAVRFAPRFAFGAVIALIHDVLVVIGALVLTQMPFDLSVLAALLTVVGFSINDTIIISDRVRENMRKFRREPLARIINQSINETLSRTIITSGTALMVLMALFLFGGHVIRPFAFTLIVGFISGVYSTIYIAAPVVLSFEKRSSAHRRWGRIPQILPVSPKSPLH
jgi:preprotein translocase subunit SecF